MLSARTDYIGYQNLASFYVGTPDPLLNNPPFGQRLIATWAIPSRIDISQYPDLHLEIRLRYRTREEQTLIVPISKRRGCYTFCVLNAWYCQTGGILTYKLLLKSGDCILEEWKQQMWVDLIGPLA